MKIDRLKLLIMFLFILLGITIAHAQKKEKTFTLEKNGNIEVSIDYGDIRIDPWDKNQVVVRYEEDEDAG